MIAVPTFPLRLPQCLLLPLCRHTFQCHATRQSWDAWTAAALGVTGLACAGLASLRQHGGRTSSATCWTSRVQDTHLQPGRQVCWVEAEQVRQPSLEAYPRLCGGLCKAAAIATVQAAQHSCRECNLLTPLAQLTHTLDLS